MSSLLLLTNALQSSAEMLPALALLPHQVRILPAEPTVLVEAPDCDVVLVDGRHDLASVRSLCRLIRTTGVDVPVIVIVTEGGLTVVAADWGVDDVLLTTAGPAEVEARLRLTTGRLALARDDDGRRQHDHPQRRRRDRRGVLHRQARRAQPRPDVQGVRAAQVPRPAPRPGLHPPAAAPGGLGLRLLRRHPHGRRPRPTPARQARPRARGADRHRPQRRLPLRPAVVDRRAGRRRGACSADEPRAVGIDGPTSPAVTSPSGDLELTVSSGLAADVAAQVRRDRGGRGGCRRGLADRRPGAARPDPCTPRPSPGPAR